MTAHAKQELAPGQSILDLTSHYTKKKSANGFSYTSADLRRYFSQVDAEIYFGDEYVDEIVDFAFSVKQNNTPISGYNSYTYDEMARGSRVIVGQFSVNFIRPNYLFEIISAAQNVEQVEMTDFVIIKNKSTVVVPTDLKKATRAAEPNAPYWKHSFSIDILIGGKNGSVNPSYFQISEVNIHESMMAFNTTGNNLVEVYQFIARDIRGHD